MATAESIAIRRESALTRMRAAATEIAAATGAAIAPFPPAHRDWQMRPAIEAEWVADALEAVASAVAKPAPKPKPEPAAKAKDKP